VNPPLSLKWRPARTPPDFQGEFYFGLKLFNPKYETIQQKIIPGFPGDYLRPVLSFAKPRFAAVLVERPVPF
jgi:hypothetical protein